jgi:hypothetical protein
MPPRTKTQPGFPFCPWPQEFASVRLLLCPRGLYSLGLAVSGVRPRLWII